MLATQMPTRFFVVPLMTLLLRHFVHLEVTLRGNPERIRNSIEKSEHCSDVHSFSNLWFRPAMIPQALHIFARGAIRRFSHLCYVLKQGAFCKTQACFIQVALGQRLYRNFFGSLNTQEVCMRVQSIWTAIEPRHPARDRFLGFAIEVALGKMNRVAEFHHVAKEIGAMAEALQNPGHVLAA